MLQGQQEPPELQEQRAWKDESAPAAARWEPRGEPWAAPVQQDEQAQQEPREQQDAQVPQAPAAQWLQP